MKQLVDVFGRKINYLRISVTDRCNLRCIYCVPSKNFKWKQRSQIMTFEEIVRVCRVFTELGIGKIRITGGEPLVRRNLDGLITQLSTIPGIETVAMTTNGVLLKDNVHRLMQAGLSSINISLDTLRRDRFKQLTSADRYQDVIEGINRALEGGFTPIKINMVVIAGVNDDEVLDFVELAKTRPVNIRFIEFMPFKFNNWNESSFVPSEKIRAEIERYYRLMPVSTQDNISGPSKDYKIDGFAGSVSFITSISDHFCNSCNRIRVTADGSIKPCLLSTVEVNILKSLRDGTGDEEIMKKIRLAITSKPERHLQTSELTGMKNRAMIQVGG